MNNLVVGKRLSCSSQCFFSFVLPVSEVLLLLHHLEYFCVFTVRQCCIFRLTVRHVCPFICMYRSCYHNLPSPPHSVAHVSQTSFLHGLLPRLFLLSYSVFSRLFDRVDLIKPVWNVRSSVCTCVHTCVCPSTEKFQWSKVKDTSASKLEIGHF